MYHRGVAWSAGSGRSVALPTDALYPGGNTAVVIQHGSEARPRPTV